MHTQQAGWKPSLPTPKGVVLPKRQLKVSRLAKSRIAGASSRGSCQSN